MASPPAAVKPLTLLPFQKVSQREHNYSELLDRYFSLGSHLNARDVKAVRKTVSALVKLLYPHGDVSREDLAELVEMAIEGRRRVKE